MHCEYLVQSGGLAGMLSILLLNAECDERIVLKVLEACWNILSTQPEDSQYGGGGDGGVELNDEIMRRFAMVSLRRDSAYESMVNIAAPTQSGPTQKRCELFAGEFRKRNLKNGLSGLEIIQSLASPKYSKETQQFSQKILSTYLNQ
jgi:hypothetical protein